MSDIVVYILNLIEALQSEGVHFESYIHYPPLDFLKLMSCCTGTNDPERANHTALNVCSVGCYLRRGTRFGGVNKEPQLWNLQVQNLFLLWQLGSIHVISCK